MNTEESEVQRLKAAEPMVDKEVGMETEEREVQE